jgi:ribosome-binding protein aMBF1 (putative translation factor)
MAAKRVERITRRLTDEEKARHAKIREQVMKEFPPAAEKKLQPVQSGIAAELRNARKARGLTYASVAFQAGLDANAVKDIEYGRNTKLGDIEAIAGALGLKLELVET